MTRLEKLKTKIQKLCETIERFGVNTVGLRDFCEEVTEIPEGMYKSLDNWLNAFTNNEVADLLYMNGYLPLEKRLEYKKMGKTDFQEYIKFNSALQKVKKTLTNCPGAFKRQPKCKKQTK